MFSLNLLGRACCASSVRGLFCALGGLRWRLGLATGLAVVFFLFMGGGGTAVGQVGFRVDGSVFSRHVATHASVKLPCVSPPVLSSFRNPETNRLCQAIVDRDLDQCKQAIRQGAGVNDIGWAGMTPLTTAYFCYDEAIFNLLLTEGGNPNLPVTDEFALQIGVTQNRSVTMFSASRSEMGNAFEVVMANGGCALGPVTRGAPLLHHLIRFAPDRISRIKLLLDHGADIEQPDRLGYSPLITSITRARRFDIVMLLIDYGADYRALGPVGPWQLVHYAMHTGSVGKPLTQEQELERQQLLRKLRSLGVSLEYAEYELYIGSLDLGRTPMRPPKVAQAMGIPVPPRFLKLEVPDYVFNNYDLNQIRRIYNPSSVEAIDPISSKYRERMPLDL